MTTPPTYDLVVLLDLTVADDVRAAIVGDIEKAISQGSGEIVRHDPWGQRSLSYPIARRTDAEYHLFQLHGPPALLRELDRTLRITDGVLRFRIIKLRPGTPPPPEMRAVRRPEAERPVAPAPPSPPAPAAAVPAVPAAAAAVPAA